MICSLQGILSFSQEYTSRNNYTGTWESPESWNPLWQEPDTLIEGYDIVINGFITANSSISFSKLPSHLIINDTLVINGDLDLGAQSNLTVNEAGILIIKGNLIFNFYSEILMSNYIIVTGNIFKLGSNNNGSFISTENPEKLFVGGRIFPTSIMTNPLFPAINCPAASVASGTDSGCNFGDLNDLQQDPIYPFFLSVTASRVPAISSSGPLTFCTGESVTLTASEGSGYLWSDGSTTQSIIVEISGSYSVSVYYADINVSIKSEPVIVTVNDLPTEPSITADGPVTFCEGSGVTLVSGPGAGYLWSTGETTQKIRIVSSGSYSVQVIDLNGCRSQPSAPIQVVVNALPVVYAGPDQTIPNGTSTALNATVTGDGPFGYSWSPADQLTNPLTEDPATVNLAATTVFTLTATSSSTTCQNSDAVKINITGGPLSVSPVASPVSVCAGSEISLDAIASGGSGAYTYSWTSVPAGFISTEAAPGDRPEVTTTYTVSVSDGFNIVTSQVTVNVNQSPPVPAISADGALSFCFGESVRLTSSPGSAYLWSNGETTPGIEVSTSGTYTVSVAGSNGCYSNESPATVVTMHPLPAAPQIVADGPLTFCSGSTVTLSSDPGAAYLWSDAETSQRINVSSAGIYTVRIYDIYGCRSPVSQQVSVEVIPQPVVNITSNTTSMCLSDQMTLTAEPAGGIFVISDGPGTLNGNVLSATATGTINVEYIYTGVCLGTAVRAISVRDCDIFIPSVITPDNDGKNDYFKLGKHEGKASLVIFNRWGTEEYSNPDYSDNWDGRNNNGNELPEDTYFYILRFENGVIKKGSVLIKR